MDDAAYAALMDVAADERQPQPVRARALVALIDEQVRRYGPRGPQLRATLEAHARGEISSEEAMKLLARLRAERDRPSIH
jgi:hypothetical protein